MNVQKTRLYMLIFVRKTRDQQIVLLFKRHDLLSKVTVTQYIRTFV